MTRRWRRFTRCTRTEGIIPALESSHALAYAAKLAAGMRSDDIIVVGLSGRGDKDIQTVARHRGDSPVSRIAARFAALEARKRTALIPFVTAGDPHPGATVPVMHAMVEAGADLIELGVPFSDPMADGPVIQRASERALAAGMTFAKVLDIAEEFRTRDEETPLVLMGYLNPLEATGYSAAAERGPRRRASTGSSPSTCLPRRPGSSCARCVRTESIPSSWSRPRAATNASHGSAPRRADSSTTSLSRVSPGRRPSIPTRWRSAWPESGG